VEILTQVGARSCIASAASLWKKWSLQVTMGKSGQSPDGLTHHVVLCFARVVGIYRNAALLAKPIQEACLPGVSVREIQFFPRMPSWSRSLLRV